MAPDYILLCRELCRLFPPYIPLNPPLLFIHRCLALDLFSTLFTQQQHGYLYRRDKCGLPAAGAKLKIGTARRVYRRNFQKYLRGRTITNAHLGLLATVARVSGIIILRYRFSFHCFSQKLELACGSLKVGGQQKGLLIEIIALRCKVEVKSSSYNRLVYHA